MARWRPRNATSEFWREAPPSWTVLANWYYTVERTSDDAAIQLARIDLMLVESGLRSLPEDERVEPFVEALRETEWPGGGSWADKAEEDLS
jgi:hypothetical protein